MAQEAYIGKYHEFPRLLGKTVRIDERELAVFRLSNDEIRVIENKSPFKGGVLAEGMVSGEYLYDPLYDWKINLTDGNVQAPDSGNVKTYPVKIEEDKVFVTL
ncbi:nitrite reductase small subunit NirD [Gracilibacillus marinus]|uniref:Nitrite reductase small subunit NirD n=1 Tax=Gracilibacillus marinus TaxID=630535 RepID=A0ABV8VRE6_9BACI